MLFNILLSCYILPAGLLNNSVRSLSNYTKSLAQSRALKLSEDQHKLAAGWTFGAVDDVYECVSAELGGTAVGRKHCERFRAEHKPACMAACLSCFRGNRCISEATAEREK